MCHAPPAFNRGQGPLDAAPVDPLEARRSQIDDVRLDEGGVAQDHIDYESRRSPSKTPASPWLAG